MHKENFHPEGELYISMDYPWDYGYICSLDRIDSFNAQEYVNKYKEQYLDINSRFLIRMKDTYDYNNLFTQEQRRILRNLPFAYRGYIFKNKELQDFFESTVWYIPNPNYTPNIEALTEDEQYWVNYWNKSDIPAPTK